MKPEPFFLIKVKGLTDEEIIRFVNKLNKALKSNVPYAMIPEDVKVLNLSTGETW